VIALIGNTPLVRFRGPSEETGCDIFGKCDFANPGGLVKDRAALSIIEDAEARGLLRPVGTIVAGTAGNTGIGLALIANAKGYRTIFVVLETDSIEKIEALRALHAELVLIASVSSWDPEHFIQVSRRIAETTPNAIWANPFDNTANRDAHIRGPAEEISTQMDGRIDGFTCAVGTGAPSRGSGSGLSARMRPSASRSPTPMAPGSIIILRSARGRRRAWRFQTAEAAAFRATASASRTAQDQAGSSSRSTGAPISSPQSPGSSTFLVTGKPI
jgi:cysteine synthase